MIALLMQALNVGGMTGAVRPTCGLVIGPHTVFWRENSGSHAFTACKYVQCGRTGFDTENVTHIPVPERSKGTEVSKTAVRELSVLA